MNNIRARFEEIWSVPDGVQWTDDRGYLPVYSDDDQPDDDHLIDVCLELDARLDTFTRCQETTPMVGVIVDDLIRELDNAKTFINDGYTRARITCTIENAKQIMEQKK